MTDEEKKILVDAFIKMLDAGETTATVKAVQFPGEGIHYTNWKIEISEEREWFA